MWWYGLGLWTKPKLCQHQGITWEHLEVSIREKLYLTLDFRLNVIAEKHGDAAGMVVLNVASKICLMMLTWFTMRITKRWPLMDLIHSIVTLVDLLSYTNNLFAISYWK